MMPSVVDVAGLNSVSTAILGNAAGAMHGMVEARPEPGRNEASDAGGAAPAVGLTMARG